MTKMAFTTARYILASKSYYINLFILCLLSLTYPSQQKQTHVHKGQIRSLRNMDAIIDKAPWSIKLLLLKNIPNRRIDVSPDENTRRVGMESLVLRRQETSDGTDSPLPVEVRDDDSNMRLKLFRLMYETVRDSDLKVKRAELIRKHYANSSAFEIGFLMGEVQEKFDVIVEFSATLQKFYDKWKPIEHINAYEQIANYGIQINHLIDLIKTIGKNGSSSHL